MASKRKQGPDGGIGAWTVAMETEGKPPDKVKERRAPSNVRGRGPDSSYFALPGKINEQRVEGLTGHVVNYKLYIMMQRIADKNAARLRRICKRSDQAKTERLETMMQG